MMNLEKVQKKYDRKHLYCFKVQQLAGYFEGGTCKI